MATATVARPRSAGGLRGNAPAAPRLASGNMQNLFYGVLPQERDHQSFDTSADSAPSCSATTSGATNIFAQYFSNDAISPPQNRRLSTRHGASPAEVLSAIDDLTNILRRSCEEAERSSAFAGWGLLSSASSSETEQIEKLASMTRSLDDISEHYALEEELGRGHFGVVRSCVDKTTGEKFACKTIETKNIQTLADVEELRAEVAVLLRLDGTPNAVGLQELFISRDAAEVHIVMEHCSGGDLFDFIVGSKNLSEREAAHVFRQVLLSVHSMHAAGVVHRDLKPENILLKRKPAEAEGMRQVDIRVADFGLALQLERGQQSQGMAGSPFYMAPEIIQGKKYSHEIDIWSMGALLYTALAGVLPFYGKSNDEIFSAIKQGNPDYTRDPWPLVSPEAKDLVQRMLTLDPTRRIQTHRIFSHPWLAKFGPTEHFAAAAAAETSSSSSSRMEVDEVAVSFGNILRDQPKTNGEDVKALGGQTRNLRGGKSFILKGDERMDSVKGRGCFFHQANKPAEQSRRQPSCKSNSRNVTQRAQSGSRSGHFLRLSKNSGEVSKQRSDSKNSLPRFGSPANGVNQRVGLSQAPLTSNWLRPIQFRLTVPRQLSGIRGMPAMSAAQGGRTAEGTKSAELFQVEKRRDEMLMDDCEARGGGCKEMEEKEEQLRNDDWDNELGLPAWVVGMLPAGRALEAGPTTAAILAAFPNAIVGRQA